MKTAKHYKGYITVVVFFFAINFWLVYQWLNYDTDIAFAWGIGSTFLFLSCLAVNFCFWFGFILAGIFKDDRRGLYFVSGILATIPIVILIVLS